MSTLPTGGFLPRKKKRLVVQVREMKARSLVKRQSDLNRVTAKALAKEMVVIMMWSPLPMTLGAFLLKSLNFPTW